MQWIAVASINWVRPAAELAPAVPGRHCSDHNAGLRRAKDAGKTIGRRRLEDDKDKVRRAVAKAVRADLQEGGVGIRKLAARDGVGVGTVLRIKSDIQAREAGGYNPGFAPNS